MSTMTFARTMRRINSKVPGILPPPPKTEIDGKLSNLSSKNISELLELKDRQQKLLSNKAFLLKLPDKGAKIQTTYNLIVSELKSKQEEEQTCYLLNKLNLNKESVQNIEWEPEIKNKGAVLDSDDDSDPEDVLHVLSCSTTKEKKVKLIKSDKPLVTPQDIIAIGEIPHVKYIVDKTEKTCTSKNTGQFKPYKTTKTDVHNPEKEVQWKKHAKWEVTAATPPPIIHGPAKLLNLEESLQLQKEYNVRLKEIEVQHAAEKLLARTGIKMADIPNDTSHFGKYREALSEDSENSDAEGSDREVHDEEPDRGGVIFTVMT